MSLISVLQSLIGAQFLNAICVAGVSGYFLWGSVPTGEPAGTAMVCVTVIFSVIKIYAPEQWQRLDSNDLVINFIGSSFE